MFSLPIAETLLLLPAVTLACDDGIIFTKLQEGIPEKQRIFGLFEFLGLRLRGNYNVQLNSSACISLLSIWCANLYKKS